MVKLLIAILIFIACPSSAFSQEIQTTTISIFQKEYQVKFVNINGDTYINWKDLTESLPGWFLVTGKGQIEVSSAIQLAVLKAIAETSIGQSSNSSDTIESNIDGAFSGWDGETIFRLVNGQIWKQSSYAYSYYYAYRPKVVITKKNNRYTMQVEGMSSTIQVTRIQ